MPDAQTLVIALGGLLFGLVIGSWLTACAHRLPRRMDLISERSRCPDCDTQILARDNLPVLGWLALGGRCRACTAPIPARYPLTEICFGAAGVAVALWNWRLAVLWVLFLLIVPTVLSLLTRRPGEGA